MLMNYSLRNQYGCVEKMKEECRSSAEVGRAKPRLAEHLEDAKERLIWTPNMQRKVVYHTQMIYSLDSH